MIIQTTFSPATAAPEPHSATPDAVKPAVVAQAPAPARTPPSKQQVEAAVDTINRSLQPSNYSLNFSLDQKSDRVVVKVVDSESGETLRQIPSEEALAIAESIDRYQKGLILSQEA
jgi:flagellar protein FlaG